MTPGPEDPPARRPQHPNPAQEEIDRAVAEYQAGRRREESFRFLHDAFYPVVRAFLGRRTGSADACLDLTQETFLRVLKGLEGYRGDAPFGAWVFSIARNVLQQAARSSLKDRWVSLEEGERAVAGALARLVSNPEGPTRALAEEERRRLREAVARLPPQRRRCVELLVQEERTYEEIAVVMRLSLGTVKAHIAQARQQLRRLLGED